MQKKLSNEPQDGSFKKNLVTEQWVNILTVQVVKRKMEREKKEKRSRRKRKAGGTDTSVSSVSRRKPRKW